jgi:hypothetical protein
LNVPYQPTFGQFDVPDKLHKWQKSFSLRQLNRFRPPQAGIDLNVDINMPFKYAAELLVIDPTALNCPPMAELSPIATKPAFRFVFADAAHPNNHMPIARNTPQRAINQPNNCELWSLSCFEDMNQAIDKYKLLQQKFQNIRKTVGDHLCGGALTVVDGMTGPHGSHTHYELFEYDTCNLSTTLHIIQALPELAQ